jgi:serine/threonine-protein kinase
LRADAQGRYWEVQIRARLSAGSYGEVFHVTREGEPGEVPARDLAIKFLKPELLETNEVVERFRREARSLASVESEEIVRFHGFGRLGRSLFIAMEFLDGQNLRDHLRELAPCSAAHARRIVARIARGLDAMHARGLIHRDLKPANVILVGPERNAVIADFGFVSSDVGSRLTGTGVFVGTVAYAAPEQLAGHAATVQSDLYALGVILYELLSGMRPHLAETTDALIRAILSEEPKPLAAHRPDLEGPVCETTMRLLARSPRDRYTSAREVLAALIDPAFDDDSRPLTISQLSTL